MEHNFNIGEIVRVELKTAFYQIVAERNTKQVYIRQVFDKKLNFKLGKAELCHRNWLHNVSKDYKTQISVLLDENPGIRKKIDDLTFDPAFYYHTWLPTLYYINDAELPELQKILSEEIEREPTNEKLNSLINEFQKERRIKPISNYDCKIRKAGESIYRVECGRYESDFDENDRMSFRCARFYKIKPFETNL